MPRTLTARLAAFAIETHGSTIPEAALRHAHGAVTDTIAVILAGSREEPARIASRWAAEMGAVGPSRVLGTAIETSPSEAAFANGVSAHALDFDDTHPHLSHPSATLVSALLAVADASGASGQQLIEAYVFGLETGAKLGRAIGHGHYMRGWHVSATIGVFAATAAVARLYGLSPEHLATAWGIAASMTSGLIRNFGTMSKSFHLGHAARSAVQSAWLTRSGFSADTEIFDGTGGFLQVYGENDGESLTDLIDTLGSPWELVTPGLYMKGWPCCYCNHRPIGGLFKLMTEHGLTVHDVEEIKVGFLPGADKPLIKQAPQTGLEAKFSIEYTASAVLLDGFLDLGSFSDAAVQRPEIGRLMQCVSRYRISSDKTYSGITGFNDLVVKTSSRTYEMRVDTMPGSLAWPLSRHQKETKFNTCVTQVLSPDQAARLRLVTADLPTMTNVRSLTEATIP